MFGMLEKEDRTRGFREMQWHSCSGTKPLRLSFPFLQNKETEEASRWG